jgi:hypothetical protein
MKLRLILYTPTNDTTDVTFDLESILDPEYGAGDDSNLWLSKWHCNTRQLPKIKQRINEYNKGKSKNIMIYRIVNPKTNLLIRF